MFGRCADCGAEEAPPGGPPRALLRVLGQVQGGRLQQGTVLTGIHARPIVFALMVLKNSRSCSGLSGTTVPAHVSAEGRCDAFTFLDSVPNPVEIVADNTWEGAARTRGQIRLDKNLGCIWPA